MIPLRTFVTSSVRCLVKHGSGKGQLSKPHYSNPGVRSFDKNLPAKELKPWEKAGLSKDEFFMRKYNNITPEQRQKLTEKVERQRRYRQMRKDHEKSKFLEAHPERLSQGPREPNRLFEYIFGTHSVRAALENPLRTSYNALFVFNGDEAVVDKAKQLGIRIIKADKTSMAKLTRNGVHNGLVLETKLVPRTALKELGHATTEEFETVVYTDDISDTVTTQTSPVARAGKFPVGLLLDGITDPMNVGGIVRTAYYMGIDFVVVPEVNSAKMGPVANKASVGALEKLPVYVTPRVVDFVKHSKRNGWNIITAASESPLSSALPVELSQLSEMADTTPILFVLGLEGDGVGRKMMAELDFIVSIPKGREGDDVVDSLNVSVAAGIIIAATTQG
ncbi:23S rRNA (guanosine(2251)-2'-O)-methyltransferase RlmB [Kocuria palustris]|nr:23S rRNA (guanosine(2251)-2'-O)-methyltransferase RlmB [Kocuria palustris]